MARWVPVEERLPEPDEDLLFLVATAPAIKFGGWHDGRNWFYYLGDMVQEEVTHWLDPHPLPGEEDEDG